MADTIKIISTTVLVDVSRGPNGVKRFLSLQKSKVGSDSLNARVELLDRGRGAPLSEN